MLLLLAILGSQVPVCSTHFASFFLGLEILSVAMYSLIAYLRTRRCASSTAMLSIEPRP